MADCGHSYRLSTYRTLCLQANEHTGQAGMADIVCQQAVGVFGLGHGQGASPELTVDHRLPEPPGLLHQQVVPLLRLPQAQEH